MLLKTRVSTDQSRSLSRIYVTFILYLMSNRWKICFLLNLLLRLFIFGTDSCTLTLSLNQVCAEFMNTRPLQPYEDKVSSVSIPGLQGSQWYCVMVQYTLFNMSVGPPSCIHCQLIPESSKNVYCLFFTRPSASARTHTHRGLEPAAFRSSKVRSDGVDRR